MAKQFKDLTPEQQKPYYDRLKLLNIDKAQVPGTVVIGEGGAKGQKGAKPAGLYSRTMVVKDLAELKKIGGNPDEHFTSRGQSDRHITYPQPLSAERKRHHSSARGDAAALKRALSPEDRAAIREAMQAYALGNSTRVPNDLVDLANAVEFPMEVTVTAADDIVVTGRFPLGENGPQTLDAGTITIESGGFIVCLNSVTINVAVMTRVS